MNGLEHQPEGVQKYDAHFRGIQEITNAFNVHRRSQWSGDFLNGNAETGGLARSAEDRE